MSDVEGRDSANGEPTPTQDQQATVTGAAPASPTATAEMPPAAPPPTPPGRVAAGAPGGPGGAPSAPRRAGVIAGAVLIGIGALMLFGRYAPWDFILRLWPLIIVVGGIVEAIKPHGDAVIKRVAAGIGTIVTGLVLLANSFGYIPWSVWLTMLALWPLLLVALGIELLGKGLKLDWLRAVSNLVLILGLLYGVFVLGPGWHGGGLSLVPLSYPSAESVTYRASSSHDAAATTGSADIRVGALSLKVSAGDVLASIEGSAAKGAEPKLSTTVTGGSANVSVTDPQSGGVVVAYPDRSLDLALDRTVRWTELRFDIGAADAEADLRDLEVEHVAVNVGASDARIWVGRKVGTVNVDVAGGATAVTIYVPADAAVALQSQSGISAVDVPASFEHLSGIAVLGDSRWSKKGSGGPTIDISLKSGVSTLTVRTY